MSYEPSMTNHSPTQSASALRCLVIVPAWNESRTVGKLVQRLGRCLPGYDVLVVDDGSTDGTVLNVPPQAKVVSLPFNLGIGGAMQTGYRYAALHGYDAAVQVDGDGQHRPSEVQRLVDHLHHRGADLVVGSRFRQPGTYRQPLTRWCGCWILGALVRLLTGLHVTDSTSGFRAVNSRVIRAFAHWYPEDYPEPEVILLLHRAGFKVEEIPVQMRRRSAGATSIPFFRGLYYVIKVITCLLLDLLRSPWPAGMVGAR